MKSDPSRSDPSISDQVIGILLVLFSAGMYYKADRLPEGTFGTMGPAFFPKILFILLAVAGGVLTACAYRKKRGRTGEQTEPMHKKPFGTAAKEIASAHKNVIVSFLLFFGYVLVMYYFGYTLATLVFMPIMMGFLGPRTRSSAVIAAAVTIGVTFGIHFGFEKLLDIFLPSGSLF
ncbi:MAG: tripartite tricarboxylate transporter TctB family protein [Desulfobacteraceae bacterium]|nr:MAG: tripartite tricarboxylate transporter TctB family protein [Desulfobacteraceae bacterium]